MSDVSKSTALGPSREMSPVPLEVLVETRALISALRKRLDEGYFDGGNGGQVKGVKAEPDI